jgi:hypothetical protein
VNEDSSELPYPTEGAHHIVRWSTDGPSVVVARTTLRGRPWGQFIRRIGAPGWWATCYMTKRRALSLVQV